MEPLCKTCPKCGTTFEAKPHNKRFCSNRCQVQTYRNNPIVEKVCKCCNKAFTTNIVKQIYCSEQCRYDEKIRVARLNAKPRPPKTIKIKKEIPEQITCICGKSFKPSYAVQKYCSIQCRSIAFTAASRDKHRIRNNLCKRLIECEICCETFTTHYPKKRFCSKKCGKKHNKQMRKAKKLNAYVEPVSLKFLLRRDGCNCGICKKPIDLSLVAPAANSPSIDHIIPLAKGGKHSKANCQAAHFLCNSKKSDSLDYT